MTDGAALGPGGCWEVKGVPKPLDLRLQDELALDEIEMVSVLMIEASDADGPLSQDRVDEILGVR